MRTTFDAKRTTFIFPARPGRASAPEIDDAPSRAPAMIVTRQCRSIDPTGGASRTRPAGKAIRPYGLRTYRAALNYRERADLCRGTCPHNYQPDVHRGRPTPARSGRLAQAATKKRLARAAKDRLGGLLCIFQSGCPEAELWHDCQLAGLDQATTPSRRNVA